MAKQATPCVFLVGPSGVGKSTLLRLCLAAAWPGGWQVRVPRKVTTRILRDSEEGAELESMSPSQIERLAEWGELLTEYESYGERYGLPRAAFDAEAAPGSLYLQALPLDVALSLRQALDEGWDVRICALRAGAETVHHRLISRADASTTRHLNDRRASAHRVRDGYADFVMDAEGSPESILGRFQAWVDREFGADRS